MENLLLLFYVRKEGPRFTGEKYVRNIEIVTYMID